jgi:hypothetical protein
MSNNSDANRRVIAFGPAAAVALLATLAAAGTPQAQAVPPAPRADQAPLLLPGEGGGSLGSLTVEGASAIRIRFERPALRLDLEPLSAPGLETSTPIAVLERVTPDLARPLLLASTTERSPRPPRPWLAAFATGSLARLKPDLRGVASWQVEIVDAGGVVVGTRSGDGAPPREIPWDGLRDDGAPAWAGLACSHVLTARDKAGNTRRFVGDSFVVPAFRVDTPDGPCLLFSAAQWSASFADGGVSPLLAEAAGILNLRVDPGRQVVVTVTAATVEEADETGRAVIAALEPRIGGASGRLVLAPRVAAGAPPGGTLRVAPRSQR